MNVIDLPRRPAPVSPPIPTPDKKEQTDLADNTSSFALRTTPAIKAAATAISKARIDRADGQDIEMWRGSINDVFGDLLGLGLKAVLPAVEKEMAVQQSRLAQLSKIATIVLANPLTAHFRLSGYYGSGEFELGDVTPMPPEFAYSSDDPPEEQDILPREEILRDLAYTQSALTELAAAKGAIVYALETHPHKFHLNLVAQPEK